MKALIIARFTLSELSRKKLLLGVLITSVLMMALYAVGMHFFQQEVANHAPRNRGAIMPPQFYGTVMVLMGLYVVNYISGLLAVFTSIGTISGEIDSGTLHAVVPRPIRRTDIVLGKWMAFASLLTVYTVVMMAAVLLIGRWIVGYSAPNVLPGAALILLQVLVLLSISMLGGTILSTLANGVTVFMLYGVAWIGGVIYTIGANISSDTMLRIGTGVNFLMPSDFLWKAASYYFQPPFMLSMSNMVGNPFFSSSNPDGTTIAYSVAYTAAAVILANFIFSRRDL